MEQEKKPSVTGRQLLAAIYVRNDHDIMKILKVIEERQRFDLSTIPDLLGKLKADYVTVIDPNYPEAFKRIEAPAIPIVVCYEGDLAAASREDLIYVVCEGDCPSDDILKKYGIPMNRAVWTDAGNHVHVGKDLTLWSDEKFGLSFMMGVAMCQSLAAVCDLSKTRTGWLRCHQANNMGKDVYVIPTAERSQNNFLIKDGANLLDGPDDIKPITEPRGTKADD